MRVRFREPWAKSILILTSLDEGEKRLRPTRWQRKGKVKDKDKAKASLSVSAQLPNLKDQTQTQNPNPYPFLFPFPQPYSNPYPKSSAYQNQNPSAAGSQVGAKLFEHVAPATVGTPWKDDFHVKGLMILKYI